MKKYQKSLICIVFEREDMVGRQILGILAIFGGLALIILALGNLIFRFIIGLFGLWLINYGLRISHQPPISIWIQRNFHRM